MTEEAETFDEHYVLEDPGSGEVAEEAPLTEEGQLERLEREAAESRERMLRAMADFENYKRRVERERSDLHRYAAVDPLREILLVVDNLELAASAEGSLDDLKSGVEMILRQLDKLLERFEVEEVPAQGEPFDPAIHDAIARFEDAGVSEPMVAEVLQKGYRLKDRLLRPAMVKVAVAPTGGDS